MYLCRLETTMKRHQGLLIRTIRDSNCDNRDFSFAPSGIRIATSGTSDSPSTFKNDKTE